MFKKRFIASLLVSTIISNTCLPTASYAFQAIEEVLENVEVIQRNKGSFPANLHFKANPQHTSAGCLFYTTKEDNIHFLFGYRDDQDSWCNMSGKSDAEDEGLHHTAFREGTEESMNFFSMQPDLLKGLPFVDLLTLQAESRDEESQQVSSASESEVSTKAFRSSLHRMYFVPVEHIDEKIINDRLEKGSSLGLKKHSLEYRKYKWVSGAKVLRAVEANSLVFDEEAPQQENEKGKEERLFKPLHQTLSTSTGYSLLKTLVTKKKLPSLKTSNLRSNTLHIAGSERDEDPTPKLSWQTIDIGESQAQAIAKKHSEYWAAKRKENDEDKEAEKIVHAQVPLTKNAFGEEESTRKVGTFPQKVKQDPKANRKILGQAVAAKALAGLELKEQFDLLNGRERQAKRLKALQDLELKLAQKDKEALAEKEATSKEGSIKARYTIVVDGEKEKQEEQEKPKEHEEDTLWNPTVSMSEMLLRTQLGEGYQEPLNASDPESRKAANVINLKAYYEKYGKTEGELKRKVDKYLESDFDRLAELMELEHQNKSLLPMYHGSEPKINYFWRISTALRRLLSLCNPPPQTLPGLRATDIYFKGHSTMEESLRVSGEGDYDNGNANRRFSANMALSAGLKTTHTSSNSIEYFLSAHSVQSPVAMKRLEEAANLLGISQMSYGPYQSLFEQYHENMQLGLTNSNMVLMFVHPSVMNKHAYPARGGGHRHTTPQQKHPTMLEAYRESQKEMTVKLKPVESRTEEASSNTTEIGVPTKLVEHMAEVRFLLHPSVMFDPRVVRVYSTSRYKISPEREERASRLLHASLGFDLGNWLAAHTKMMPDSYTGNPALKTLYRYAYEGETGETVREELTAGAFPHLVKNGHFEGVKLFYEQFPALVEALNIAPRKLVSMAMDSGNADLVKYVLETILHCDDLSEVFSKGEILTSIAVTLDDVEEKGADLTKYMLTKLKRDFFTEEEKTRIIQSLFLKHHKKFHAIAKFINDNFYPIDEDFIRKQYKALKKQDRFPFLDNVRQITHLPLHMILNILFDVLEAREADISYQTHQLLKAHPDLDFAAPSLFGDPLIFRFMALSYLEPEIEGKIKLIKNLIDIKNRDNLTLLQYMQKGWLSGRFNPSTMSWSMLSSIQSAMESEKRDYVKESYPPFIEEMGDMRSYSVHWVAFPSQNLRGDTAFDEWREGFLKVRESDNLTDIMRAFAIAPRVYALYYAGSHPTHYASQQSSLSYYRRGAMYSSLRRALESGEREQVERVKSTLPFGMMSKWDIDWTSIQSEEKFSDDTKDIEEKHRQWAQENEGLESKLEKELDGVIEANSYKRLMSFLGHLYQNYYAFVGNIMKKLSSLFPQIESVEDATHYFNALGTKATEFEKAVDEGRVSGSDAWRYLYAYASDEHHDVFKRTFPKIFPRVEDLREAVKKDPNPAFNLIGNSDTNHKKALPFLLEHYGWAETLTGLEDNMFSSLIFNQETGDQWQETLVVKCPEVFAHQDRERDFLRVSFGNVDGLHTPEFAIKNLQALKTTYDERSGLPLIFMMFDPTRLDPFKKVLEHDPTILDLRSKHGASITEVISVMLDEDTEQYNQVMGLLKSIQK
jgi:hypothetical protein